MMVKIAVTGPESSGKSTLCRALAMRLHCPWVPEYAREHLLPSAGRYVESDLLDIALGQCAAEDAAMRSSPHRLMCDTDMLTVRIWSEERFGRCDQRIVSLTEQRHYDHWLLCRPDIPWEQDPLRENPLDRERLFEVYERMLRELRKPFTVIHGTSEERERAAMAVITALASG